MCSALLVRWRSMTVQTVLGRGFGRHCTVLRVEKWSTATVCPRCVHHKDGNREGAVHRIISHGIS